MRALLLLAAFVSSSVLACSVPKPGSGYSLEDLIDQSENIVLVEMVEQTIGDHHITSKLKVVDVLKGELRTDYVFVGYSGKHESATYSDHYDAGFWFNDIGRSAWPCCICGPDHTFKKGFQYLYFPDLLGARKSAEIIKSKDDRWLKFVQKRVLNGDS